MSGDVHSESGDPRLQELIAEYLAAIEADQPLNREELLARHPELVDSLAAFFRDHDRMNGRADELLDPESTGNIDPNQARTLAPGEPATSGPKFIRYFGDYELLEEIARGGMGVVFRARQVSLNRVVALKMILAGRLASPDDVARFHREAEAAANLDHPNIVPIYEVGDHEGQHYFSMKLIEGGSLAARKLPLPARQAAELIATVSRAVHHAHQRGILHRDLKPANILMYADSQPYVADFGLARRVASDVMHTRTGGIVGTPSYMAPEQARSEKVLTTAVDVYSLGAVLYELVTGRPPFRAETQLDTILQVLDREPPRPRTLNPIIDRELETICLKCLAKEPGKRYGSAQALADDLDRWLAGQPIQARPSGPARRVLKWARRNPALAALLVVLPCWYFNVRLAWEWAWLDWALFGVLAATSIPRLLAVCRRAMGSPTNTPLNLQSDAFVLPGTLLAMLTLGFYKGDWTDRKTLAFAMLFTSNFCGFVIQWLVRRKRAGPLSVAVRTPLVLVISCGIFLGMLSIQSTYELISMAGQTGHLFVYVGSRIQGLTGYLFLFLMISAGIEIRTRACVTFFRFIRWEEIQSFEWRRAKNLSLILRLNLRNNPLPVDKVVYPVKKKEMLEQVLLQHVPQVGHDVESGVEGPQVFARRGRKPAERLRDPAVWLFFTGILQIAGAVALSVLFGQFVPGWEMWKFLLLAFLAVSAFVGVIVCIGAWRMYRLKNYRFCRACSILAMVPTGAGFGPGVLFGLLALWELRRADVKAAFAENESLDSD